MSWIECNSASDEPERIVHRFLIFPTSLPSSGGERHETRIGWQKIVQWERVHVHHSVAGIGGAHPAKFFRKIWINLKWAE